MTTIARELDELRLWRPLPASGPQRWPEELVHNEFMGPAEREAMRRRLVGAILEYTAENVPYYKKRLRRAGVGPDYGAPDALSKVPILTRDALQENTTALHSLKLPPGDPIVLDSVSSGTTGQPTRVPHTAGCRKRMRYLTQRQFRWYRFDPMGTRAAIRPFTDLPKVDGAAGHGLHDVVRTNGWFGLDQLFHTGRFVGLANTQPIETQVEFVRRERPNYLLMQSAGLEHLAFALAGEPPLPDLRAAEAISQTLTPAMRRAIEGVLRVPVHQNYGLNEVGIVASRCPEGGRYHVHSEQAVIEIVDADGQPVRPGEQGRVLVTLLTNTAMPILRYDADDLATAADGPCPCGRTLPSFGEVIGRYRRIAQLPPGTWARWGAIQLALYQLPAELSRALRKYQALQHADGSWDLRLSTSGDEALAIGEHVRAPFAAAAPGEPPPLRIVATDQFEGDPRGKFQSFLSHFVPAMDTERTS